MFIVKYNNAYVTGYDSKRVALNISFNKPDAMKFDSKQTAKRFITNRGPKQAHLTIQSAK